MTSEQRAGRPRASSRATLAEAACELFLEQGYDATSVADITRRAGVSRSSFFNYFSSKSDVLWSGLDERIAGLEDALAAGEAVDSGVTALVQNFVPDALALALVNATVMGIAEDLDREAAVRAARIARAVSAQLIADGIDHLGADVRGGFVGSAVLASLRHWAAAGAGVSVLSDELGRALALWAWQAPAGSSSSP